jgi:outer membrane biogenesis lipoprotein LolB
MKLFVLVVFLLAGCSEHTPSESFNSPEPTLQSAQDANTKEFTEDSFK